MEPHPGVYGAGRGVGAGHGAHPGGPLCDGFARGRSGAPGVGGAPARGGAGGVSDGAHADHPGPMAGGGAVGAASWGELGAEAGAPASWFAALRDRAAKVPINIRIRRLSLGNFGDFRPVGEGVSELRIHYGPGYRIYLKKQGDALVILLAGGDKSSQDQDIRFAKELARNL